MINSMPKVRKWCEEIVEKSPTAIALAKRSFNVDTEMIRGMGMLERDGFRLKRIRRL